MKISAIVRTLGWDEPCKVKGNSMVRNALRRLVRSGLIIHNTQIGDGTYIASDIGPVSANPQPIDQDNTTVRAMVASMKNDCVM